MKKISLCYLLFLTSCMIKPNLPATAIPSIFPSISTSLPVHPKDIKLDPNITKDGNWTKSMEAGSCTLTSNQNSTKPCPSQSGILFSEEAASKAYLYKTSYEELRTLYSSDLLLWKKEQELYEKTIQTLQKENEELKKHSWFQENSFTLGVAAGILLSGSGLLLISKTK